jgi:hypothetical protein
VLAILIAVVTLFMLLDGAQIWWWLLDHLPIRHKQRFNILVQRNLLGFFWGRLLLSIFFGVSAFVVFWLLGVPFPLVLAAIAGVFDLIPGIGATLGIGLVCILLLSQSVWLSMQVLVSCVALQQVEENVLLPHIMKDSLDINPVVMFFALIVGATGSRSVGNVSGGAGGGGDRHLAEYRSHAGAICESIFLSRCPLAPSTDKLRSGNREFSHPMTKTAENTALGPLTTSDCHAEP